MPRSPQQIADYRAQLKESMGWAIAWREGREERLAEEVRFRAEGPARICRCGGSGLVWRNGKPREGGRRGPCPGCQKEGSARFARQLSRELWP